MKRIDVLLASVETRAVDPTAETVINGTPYDVSKPGRVSDHFLNGIADDFPDDDEGPRLSEERDR